jgi:hypothetical protein
MHENPTWSKKDGYTLLSLDSHHLCSSCLLQTLTESMRAWAHFWLRRYHVSISSFLLKVRLQMYINETVC